MAVDERRKPSDVVIFDPPAAGTHLIQRCLRVARVPEHDRVDDEAERAELVLLSFLVPLPQLAALAEEDGSRNAVATLAAVDLAENAATIGLVIEVG